VARAQSASNTVCSTAARIRRQPFASFGGSVGRTQSEWKTERPDGRSAPPREAFVHGHRTPVRGDRANTALSLECAAVRRHQLARVRCTVLVAGRYPTCETCSGGRPEGPRTLAVTSVRRDATDEAHSHVHDAIRTVIRKATSGIPGRNSRSLFEQFATFRKTRRRYLLRKIAVLQIARLLARTRKSDHFVRFVFADDFSGDRNTRIL
jgi:hypothetical protein